MMAVVTALDCPKCDGTGVVGDVVCPDCEGSGEFEAPQAATPPLETAGDVLRAAGPADLSAAWDGAERRATPPVLPDEVSTALATVTTTNTTITEHVQAARELAETYRGVVFPVATVKGMDEACKARAAIREHRYAIDKLQKAGSKMLGTMQRQFNRRAEELTAEIAALEAPIHEQITAEEQRKAREREEREAAEARRRQGHIDAIAAIARIVTDAAGMDSTELQAKIAAVDQLLVDDGYEEFQGQAQQAKDETLRQLNGMLVAARADEAEAEETRQAQARFAAAQLQLEAERRAQVERERILAEREAAADEREKQQKAEAESLARAKQDRAERIQQKIDGFAAGVKMVEAEPHHPDAILTIIDAFKAVRIDTDYADDRVSETTAARDRAVAQLMELRTAAIDRVAEEARAAQAARIEQLIADIRAMGENAALAVEDGSAELEGLRAGLHQLRDIEVTREAFGERFDEAAQVKLDATAAISDAIDATIERDRLAAEEAERQRLQKAAEAEARALVDAKRSHGEELYEVLRRLVIDLRREGLTPQPAMTLLLQINPSETFEDEHHA